MAVRGTLHFRARRGGSTLMVGVDKSGPGLAIPPMAASLSGPTGAMAALRGGNRGIRRGAARSSGGDGEDRQRQEAAGREGHGKRDDPTSPVVMGYRELGLDTPRPRVAEDQHPR